MPKSILIYSSSKGLIQAYKLLYILTSKQRKFHALIPLCFVLRLSIKETVMKKTMQLKKKSPNAKLKKNNSEKKKGYQNRFKRNTFSIVYDRDEQITGHVTEINVLLVAQCYRGL